MTEEAKRESKVECIPRIKGIFFLSMVVIIWVGSAILIQMIFDSPESQFAKPLFLTYFSTSFFTLYLIPLIYKLLSLKCKSRGVTSEQAAAATIISEDQIGSPSSNRSPTSSS